jgi:hypothetical protein
MACDMHGEKTNAYRILVGESEAKKALGRIRCRRENNMKMNVREMGWGGMG